MRYYLWLGAGLAITALILGAAQFVQWWGKVDTTIPLKTMNQQIAPSAVTCARAYYARGSQVTCLLEGSRGRTDIDMIVTANSIQFADPGQAQDLMMRLND